MKKILFVTLLCIPVSIFAQQIIRGYSASFSYGLLAKGDDFTIHYSGDDYTATARKTEGGSLGLGFPFDFGYKRSRLVITPGLDFLTSNYQLDLETDIPGIDSDSDSLKLSSFMIIPKVGIMYKFHFYVKSVHIAFGLGADANYPVSNNITLKTKDKAEIIEYNADYNENPPEDSNIDYMVFKPNTVYSNMADLGFHINPKIGLDIYVTKYLITNITIHISPLTTYSDKPIIRGYAGFGASYLMPLGKEDDSRLLQYYKQ
ncbi:MAG TPA: hypothetical protein PLL66_00290 [Bacteroidales bacterium]|nr:hypothetical protein [Bacteroidales bacterium]